MRRRYYGKNVPKHKLILKGLKFEGFSDVQGITDSEGNRFKGLNVSPVDDNLSYREEVYYSEEIDNVVDFETNHEDNPFTGGGQSRFNHIIYFRWENTNGYYYHIYDQFWNKRFPKTQSIKYVYWLTLAEHRVIDPIIHISVDNPSIAILAPKDYPTIYVVNAGTADVVNAVDYDISAWNHLLEKEFITDATKTLIRNNSDFVLTLTTKGNWEDGSDNVTEIPLKDYGRIDYASFSSAHGKFCELVISVKPT